MCRCQKEVAETCLFFDTPEVCASHVRFLPRVRFSALGDAMRQAVFRLDLAGLRFRSSFESKPVYGQRNDRAGKPATPLFFVSVRTACFFDAFTYPPDVIPPQRAEGLRAEGEDGPRLPDERLLVSGSPEERVHPEVRDAGQGE